MLEYPEASVISEQISDTLRGKVVDTVITGASEHRFAFYSPLKDSYNELLKGSTLLGAKGAGGLVTVDIGEYLLYFSDGASPRFIDSAQAMPKKHQFFLSFTDATAIYATVAMYGGMQLWKKGKCDSEYYISSSSKPGILTEEFTLEYFMGLYPKTGKKMSLKAFLATEQRIPGLGNGVLQDICFNAHLDPRSEMSRLSEEELIGVYEQVRETIKNMTQRGGRNTQRDLFGEPGGYRSILCNETLNSPCPRCGGVIEKKAYMGGTIYYCSGCQEKK